MNMQLPNPSFNNAWNEPVPPVEDRLYFLEQGWHLQRKAEAWREKIQEPAAEPITPAAMHIGGFVVGTGGGLRHLFNAFAESRALRLEKQADEFRRQV